MPALEVLYEMERNGVLIDVQVAGDAKPVSSAKRMLELEAQRVRIAGQPFNLNSPKQIREILFDKLKLPVVKKTPRGTPSTDEEVLQKLALDYPLPKILLEYRGLAKLKSTYTDKLPRMVDAATGRVHTNYAQAVAVTGRLSPATNPTCRTFRCAPPKAGAFAKRSSRRRAACIVSADYSQIELRIMAHISQDAGLLNAFAEGEDIHRATAAEVFGVAAGRGEQRAAPLCENHQLRPDLRHVAHSAWRRNSASSAPLRRAYMDRYFARYPGVRAITWQRHAAKHAKDARLRRNRIRPPAVAAGDQ